MRLTIAWLGGLGAFGLLHTLFDWLGDQIGVPVLLDLGYTEFTSNRWGDYETDTTFTTFGMCTSFLTFMLAIRVGMLINRETVGQAGNVQFVCWLFGLSILAVLSALIYLAFLDTYSYSAHLLELVLQISAGGGVWWSMKTLHDKKIEELRKSGSR